MSKLRQKETILILEGPKSACSQVIFLKSGPFVLILVLSRPPSYLPVCSYAFVKCNPMNSIKRQKGHWKMNSPGG